jgi:hypothetical protein
MTIRLRKNKLQSTFPAALADKIRMPTIQVAQAAHGWRRWILIVLKTRYPYLE